jgi:hypothetical protein
MATSNHARLCRALYAPHNSLLTSTLRPLHRHHEWAPSLLPAPARTNSTTTPGPWAPCFAQLRDNVFCDELCHVADRGCHCRVCLDVQLAIGLAVAVGDWWWMIGVAVDALGMAVQRSTAQPTYRLDALATSPRLMLYLICRNRLNSMT